MKKLLLSLFIIFVLAYTNGMAEEREQSKNSEWPLNRIGLTASTFTGYGLTYYRHFGEKFVGKICFFAFGSSNESGDNSSDIRTIAGGELQYNLHKTKYTRLHIFTAFSYWYNESKYETWSRNDDYTNYDIERNYVSGIGFGFEFLAWHIISFNIETGILYRYGVNTQSNEPGLTNDIVSYPRSFGFGINGGITYAF